MTTIALSKLRRLSLGTPVMIRSNGKRNNPENCENDTRSRFVRWKDLQSNRRNARDISNNARKASICDVVKEDGANKSSSENNNRNPLRRMQKIEVDTRLTTLFNCVLIFNL